MNTTLLFTKRIALTAVLLVLTISGFAQTGSTNVPGTYSFTVPAGVTSVTLAAWGGGGGGGGSTNSGFGGSGGGGGGAVFTTTNVNTGNVFTLVVGAGGAGGAATALGVGGTGGQSRISATTPAIDIRANGGTGASNNSGLGSIPGSGGTTSGGTGSNGNGGTAGNASGQRGGNSGTALGLFGVGGAPVTNTIGNPGGDPGAGGGGGEASNGAGGARNGGAGANGFIFLRYITVTAATSPVCVGGTITITGDGFDTTGTTTVTINGTAATSVIVVNATTITAVVAPGTTGGNIEIINPNGTNNSRNTTINPSPTVNAGGALTAICNNASTAALGGTFGGAATSAVWSSNVGGTFTNNGGATPSTATWTPAAGFVGTATLTLTTAGGSCGTVAASKNIVVNGPTVNAGPILASICEGNQTNQLQGAFGGTATAAVWSSNVGGTFSNNGGSTPNTTRWTPPAGYSGTATLTLTTSGGSCGTTLATKTQTVDAIPVATVGSNQTLISTFVSDPLGANTPSVGTGTWTVRSTPGGANVTFSNVNDPNATATVDVFGAYVFRWSITSPCGNSNSDISVTFLPVNDPTNTLYYENFDNNNGSWASSGTTGSWGYTNTAGSPHRGEGGFWAVNTTAGAYPNNALTYVTSPVINTTGFNNVKLFIDVRYDLPDAATDGLQVQYSTNGGTSWAVLGTGIGAGWYTKNNIATLSTSLGSQLGWDSDSSLYGSTPTPVAAPASQFLEKSIQSNVLNNIAQLRIRLVFTSNNATSPDTGVALDNVIIKGNPITPIPDPVLGPGSVNANLKLWLKANTGTSTVADGNPVASWNDQAYDNNSVGITGNSPIFRNNATRNINFNPVIDFSASAAHVMKGKGGWWSQEYYVVVKTNGAINNSAAARQVPISGRLAPSSFELDGTALGLGNFTQRYNDEVVSHNLNSVQATPSTATQSYGRAYTSTTDSYNQQTIIFTVKTNASGTGTEIYKNGKRIDNTTGQAVGSAPTFPFQGELNFSNFNNIQYNLGVGRFTLGGNVSSFLDGRMTEVVSYSQQKSTVEQQKIQSYLGIKNGITLHATGSTTADNLGDIDYIDSAGNTIWDVSNNAGYNYDIAGIGRDDATILNQKQSKTENTGSDISMGLGNLFDVNSNNPNSFDSNRKFLMWGNNQGTLAAQPPIVVNLSSGITPVLVSNVEFVSVGRTWKVVETGGNIPSVKVSIPSAMLTATITPPGDYLMFISDSPVFSPTAEYRTMVVNGANLEADYDFNGTKYITFGYAPERTFVRSVDFDGNDDYMDAGNVLNLPSNYTISAWVKKSRNNRTILSKRNAALTEGYDLSINGAGRAEMTWFNSSTRRLTSSVVLPNDIWHHIAVIYNGTTAIMYIDGVADTSLTAPGVITNTQSFLIGAANNGASPNRFFEGNIDEVRVWSTALTVNQLRYSMNQEIMRNGTLTNGRIIPNNITLNEISAIPWSSLSAYYPMSTYTYTNAKDISNNNFTAAIKNLNTVDYQTAPLPYESAANGNWETATTWTNNTVQDIPNSPSLVNAATIVDWNIVRTNHNINSVGNKTVLGLFVNSNTLSASSDSKIEVTNYLRLDGKIDLVGRSQLVQKTGSDLDILSSGTLERDQQGQANLYNYNYWGSPVGTVNTLSNNANYTVAGVLRDGTSPSSPALFQWTSSLNANNTTVPKTLSRYWINKFDNVSNAYANWSRITETDPLRAGQGFTLKGTGAATATQNLVFVGKPNNGTITNTVGKEQLLLVANPYPSALDAVKFINDNLGGSNDVITGSLYFWEHYTTNNSHFLKQYQGGYGVRNLSGGAAPSSDDLTTISGFGVTSKAAPNQFIPVGQGFFVIGNESGASTNLQFNNSQREFIKEDNAQSQTMYRTSSSKAPVKDHWTDNSDTKIEPGSNKKIHIGFNLLSNNFHRQVLLAFMDEKANNDINPGYDALNIDGSPSDMYLLNKDKMLIIQGEGYFNKDASYPIAVKMEEEGKVSFVIDNLENFDADQNYFIYDAQTDTYNSIKKGPFEVLVAKGEHKTRFALHFTDKKAATVIEDPNATNNKIEAIFTRYNNTLNITNGVKDATIETVQLYNIQGACIKTWDIKDKTQFYHKLPITENSSEFYIVKIKTSKGIMTQKIIVK